MLDRLNMRRPFGRMASRKQPGLDRLGKLAGFGKVICDHFRLGLLRMLTRAEHGGHTEVDCLALRLQHQFVGDPLQQGVAEFVLNLGAVAAWKQNLRLDERLERFGDSLRLLLHQCGQKHRGKRAPDDGSGLDNPARTRTTIKAPRHLFRKQERNTGELRGRVQAIVDTPRSARS